MEVSRSKRNLIMFIISFSVGMLYFVPYIRFSFYDQTLEIFSINNAQMGILGSVYGTVAIGGYLISGILADKIAPKKLLALSCFACAVITVWLAQIPQFPMLIVIYALYSVFTIATTWSPYMVLLRNLGTEEEQGRLYGISEALRNVFSALAGYLFLWIFSLFTSVELGYRGMLYVSAIFYIAFGIMCMKLIPDITLQQENVSDEKTSVNTYKVHKIPGVWLMGLFIFCCYNVIITQLNYLGTYGTQVLGMSTTVASILAILRSYIIPILAGVIAGYAVDKAKSRSRALTVILVILASVCILTPALESNQLLNVIMTMMISMLAMMLMSTYWSIMGECNIPLEYTALASGVISFIAYLPDTYVTIVIGKWLDQDPVNGFKRVFVWMTIWSVLAAIVAVIIYLRNKKQKI